MSTARRRLAAATCVLVGAVLATSGIGSAVTPTQGSAPMQFGFDSFVTYSCQGLRAYEHDATAQIDDDRALHANSIALAFPIYMPSLTSDEVAARLQCGTRYESPPVGLLTKIVGIARAKGLSVLLRPLVALRSPGGGPVKGWRGIIAPADPTVWFEHYWTAIRPYLVMAQATHVKHVALASELDSIADAPQWTALVARAQQVYTGNLVFDVSWNTPVLKIWKHHTSAAVDAYPNLTDTSSGQSPTQLLGQWDGLLASNADYSIPDVTKVAIDEVGILAQVGAYGDPAASALTIRTHPFNQSIQVRWFTAACAFVKQHRMRGLYFWGAWMSAGALPASPVPSHPSFIQPATQAAIRKCFT